MPLVLSVPVSAQPYDGQTATQSDGNSRVEVISFLVGAGVGLAAHEGGHLLFNVLFDADPGVKKIAFGPFPFFAITHRPDVSRRREFVISSAGIWVQNATNEWLLTKRPRLREERAPFAKGLLTFNLLLSAGYSGIAFAGAGPAERDTRSMATSGRMHERWVGVMILAPAVLDAVRYFNPDAGWARWSARGAKAAAALMVIR